MKKALLFLGFLIVSTVSFAQADLAVFNTDYKGYYKPNVNNSYTITIINYGPQVATNVNIVANVPSDIEEFSWVGPDGTDGTPLNPDLEPDSGNDNINYIIPSIAVGQVMSVVVTMGIPGTYQGNLIFQASVSGTEPDPKPANNISIDTDLRAVGADIEITNTNNQIYFTPGTSAAYTVKVTNKGPLEATNVQVSNAIPAGVTNFTWSGSNGSTGTDVPLANTIATLAVNATVTYTVAFDIPAAYAGNTLVNQVTYTSAPTDPVPACPQCTDTDTKLTGADIVVTNTDGQTTYTQGGTRVYTVTVKNNGPDAASNVHVVDAIPLGISQFSWTGSNGSSGTNIALDDTIATLASGATVTYTITIQIPVTFTGNLKNEVVVTSVTPDPYPGCTQCVDIDTLASTGNADLVITNTDGQLAYVPGLSLTYTVKVTNNGPVAASNVQVLNAIPSGITQFSWTGTNNTSGTDVALTDMIGSLANGQSVTYTITLQVPVGYTNVLRSEAIVSSTTNDPNLANNNSIDTDNLAAGADIVIVNTNNQTSYVPGSTVVYTVTVTNNGPSNAVNFTVTNLIPTGITQFSWTGSNGSSGTNVALIDNTPTFTVGSTIVYTITVQVPLTFTGNLVSTTSKSTPTPDPNTACTACTDTDTRASSDLSITNTDNNAAYIPGGTSVYTVTITNNGPNPAQNVVVSNPIPTGITQFSWTGSNGSNGTNVALNDIIPVLAEGAIITYTITIQVPVAYTGNLVSQASVTSGATDATPANNQATDTNVLGTGADIIVVNTNGQDYYVPGSTVVYTINVTNNGPSDAVNVNVSNLVPAGITQFSWVATNGSNGTNVPVNNIIPLFANGETVTYTVTLQVPSTYTGNLTSTTVITSDTPDPNASCPQCTDTDLPATADVFVGLTDNKNLYTPGTTVVYTLTAKNNGPATSDNVQVNYPMPVGITQFSWTGNNGTSGTNANLADTITLLANETVTYTITIQIPAGFTGDFVNTATIATATPDPVLTNNTSTDTNTPIIGADIVVINSDGISTYVAGQDRTYTIKVTNFGPSDATNVVVKDLVTAGIPAANVTWSGNSASGTGDLNNTIGTLAVGQTVTYTIIVKVPSGFSQTSNLVNEVIVTSDTPDPNPGCTQCVDTDTPTPFADLNILKTDNQLQFLLSDAPTPENPNPKPEINTYTIVISNNGPSDALNINVQDLLPPGIAPDKMNWFGPNGTSGSGTLTGNIAVLPAGEVATYVVTIQIPLTYSPPDPNNTSVLLTDLVNKVTVTSTTPDPVSACPGCIDTDTPRSNFLTVNSTKYTVTQLVEDILVDTPCANISNFTASPATTIGYFHRNNSEFPFKSGVIIRNGIAANSAGPYTNSNLSSLGTGMGGQDAELQAVNNLYDPNPLNPGTINDVSFIKFNFKPLTEDFSFNFLFAANEYGQFQCQWADVFAFILTDLDTGLTENLAVIPGTNIPVQVTKIRNSAYNGACSSANIEYFGEYYANNGANAAINMRGRTIPMTAYSPVIPNHNYSIKLVIGDYNDQLYDSAVFIEAGSFNVGVPEFKGILDDAYGTELTQMNATVCDGLTVTLKAGDVASPLITYTWSKNGVVIPGEITNFIEVTEPGTYSIKFTLGANCSKTKSMTIDFMDPLPLNEPQNISLCTLTPPFEFNLNQDPLILNGANPGNYVIQYYRTEDDARYDANAITDVANYNPLDDDPTLTPPFSKQIYVNILDQGGANCQVIKEFTISAATREGTISYPATDFCFGQSPNLISAIPSTNLTPAGKYIATPQSGLAIDENTGEINIANSSPGNYSVVYNIAAGNNCAEFNTPAQVININLCLLLDPLADVCAGATFNLQTTDAGAGAVYTWYEGATALGTTPVPSLNGVVAPALGGTYSYTVVVTVGTVSSTSSPQPLIVHPTPEVTISGPSLACTGQNSVITFTGTPNATVIYDDGSGDVSIVIPASGIYELIVSLLSQTTYQIKSIAGNTIPDCMQNITTSTPGSFLTVDVGQPDATITSVGPVTICSGTDTSFVISGTPGAQVNVSVTNDGGTEVLTPVNIDAATGVVTFQTGILSVSGDNIFSLTEVISNGSCSAVISNQSFTVSVKALPAVASFTSATSFVCSGNPVTLNFVGTPNATITYNNGTANDTVTLDGTGAGSAVISPVSMASPMKFSLLSITTDGIPSCITTFTPALDIFVDIYDLPQIVTGPVSKVLCPADTTVSYTVTATGTNITYQWFKSGDPTPLADNGHYAGTGTATLTINNPGSPADIGSYYCRVSNPDCGFDDSALAGLSINAPTQIDTQPTGGTICEGTPLTKLTVAASGLPGLTYQWYFGVTAASLSALSDAGNVSGAATNELSITNLVSGNAGFYQCRVSSSCPGEEKTDIVEIIVSELPEITAHTNDATQCAGKPDPVILSVTAFGTNITYQWFRNNVPLVDGGNISGSTTDTLNIYPADVADTGDYTCRVTGDCGTVQTGIIPVSVPVAPSITLQPVAELARCEGDFFTLHVDVPSGFTLQWQLDGIDLADVGNVSGATTGDLTISNVGLSDDGSYTVVVRSSLSCDPLVSDATDVTINVAPKITAGGQPESAMICEASTHTLSVVLENPDEVSYQWLFNGNPMADQADHVSGSQTANLTLSNVTAVDQGTYTCLISSACPNLTSQEARIIIVPLAEATITNGVDQEICSGNSADVLFLGTPSAIVSYTINGGAAQTITLNPSGTAVLDTGILTETTTYELLSAQRNDNPSCPAPLTGNPMTVVTVIVNPFPNVRLDQDGYICLDPVTNFATTDYLLDTGLNDPDYAFQWYLDNVLLTGETGSSILADKGGMYKVEVTNTVTLCSGFGTAPMEVSVPPLSITAEAETTFFDENGTIRVTVTPAGEYEYRLDNGPYQSSNVFTNVSTLSGMSQGLHTVYARDLKACDELPFDVRIIDYPKYFTPNGDGYHDTWNISALNEQSNAKIYIFDRFGKLVKQISTTGMGWDGTLNGQPMTADDYWFVIKYLEQGINKEFKAHFSLKR